MTLAIADWIVLAGYLCIVLGIGIYFSRVTPLPVLCRRASLSCDRPVAGGHLHQLDHLSAHPPTPLKLTGYASSQSGITACDPGGGLCISLFPPRQHDQPYEFLEMRYGPSVRVYGAVAFLVAQVVRLAMILWLLSLLIQQVTGLSPTTAIVLGGLFVGLYTVIGGIDAVIWTDVLQTVVLLLGGILCVGDLEALPAWARSSVAGRPASLRSLNGAPGETSWSLSLSSGHMVLLIGLTNCCEYSVIKHGAAILRITITPEASRPVGVSVHRHRSGLFTCFWVPRSGCSLKHSRCSGRRHSEWRGRAETLMPHFITGYLPAGVAGLVIAAALAAAMSSLDSSINSVTTVSVVDLTVGITAPAKTIATT